MNKELIDLFSSRYDAYKKMENAKSYEDTARRTIERYADDAKAYATKAATQRAMVDLIDAQIKTAISSQK